MILLSTYKSKMQLLKRVVNFLPIDPDNGGEANPCGSGSEPLVKKQYETRQTLLALYQFLFVSLYTHPVWWR